MLGDENITRNFQELQSSWKTPEDGDRACLPHRFALAGNKGTWVEF